MLSKELLKRENERLREEIKEKDKKILTLKMDICKYAQPNTDLNLKYMLLQAKYKKLLDDITSKETEIIVYNGNAYRIKSIDYHKQADELDTINIEAINVPQEKGLINNLTDTFKDVAKEFNKIMFGTTND